MKKQFRDIGASVACKRLAAFRISVILSHFLIKNTENRSYSEKNEKIKKSRFSLFFQFENIASLFFLLDRLLRSKSILLRMSEYSEALEISVGPTVHETNLDFVIKKTYPQSILCIFVGTLIFIGY